jgi:hypothetical protein
MAYNTMSPIKPRPYFINNNRGVKKQNEDNESSQSSRSSENQIQPQISSQNYSQEQIQTKNFEKSYQSEKHNKKSLKQQLQESKASQQSAIAARDANIKNATINIAQILKDFKNTTKAIGSSPELTEEVNAYLDLIEKQITKDNPDSKLIKSNLKNASSLLDNYISETLQRPSKVVENWIDALFLQQINYKFNEDEINPQFLVKFPNQKTNEENSTNNSNQNKENNKASQKSINIPSDEKLKSLFVQAKKYTYINNSQKAMEVFNQALERAVEISDKETESKILYEIGKIYDDNDYLSQALSSYNRSLTTTKDLNIKTKAHYSMAQIYDDIAQFEPAINHYMSSISYAGENENLIAQTTSLTKIGNIYSDEYKKEAFEFLLEADTIASETKNSKVKGYVSSNIANAYNKINESHKALKYYSKATKDYQDAKSPQKVAINYKRAAELMQDFNNPKKAQTLFGKALQKAKEAQDAKLIAEINEALSLM